MSQKNRAQCQPLYELTTQLNKKLLYDLYGNQNKAWTMPHKMKRKPSADRSFLFTLVYSFGLVRLNHIDTLLHVSAQ